MLEQPRLLLLPWETSPQAPAYGHPGVEAGRRRPILDPETGQSLGFAAPGRSERSWWSWLRRQTLLWLFEAEDEPLLLTVDRFWHWGWRWEVRDADGHGVGRIQGAQLRDRLGRVLAVLGPGPNDGDRRFHRPDGS